MKKFHTTESYIYEKLANLNLSLQQKHSADKGKLDELEHMITRLDRPGKVIIRYSQKLHEQNLETIAHQIKGMVGSDDTSVPLIVQYLACFRDTTCARVRDD